MKAFGLAFVLAVTASIGCSKSASTSHGQGVTGHWRQMSQHVSVAEPGWRQQAAAKDIKADHQVDLFINEQTIQTIETGAPPREEPYTLSSSGLVLSDDHATLRRSINVTSPSGSYSVTTVYSRVDDKTTPP